MRLKVEEEFNMIDARIRSSEHRENFELSQRHAVSLADLQELILRFRPNIIHFSGHGSTQGTLVFEDSAGYPEEAPPDALASLFRILNEDPTKTDEDKIRCVVLSACYSNKKQADAICKVCCMTYVRSIIQPSEAQIDGVLGDDNIMFNESTYRIAIIVKKNICSFDILPLCFHYRSEWLAKFGMNNSNFSVLREYFYISFIIKDCAVALKINVMGARFQSKPNKYHFPS